MPTTVTVNYPVIDEGKTRYQENEERKARNAEQERLMLGIVTAEAQLQRIYAEATGAKPDDPTDPLATIVALHMRDHERETRKEERMAKEEPERVITGGREEQMKRTRDPIGGLALGGLAIIGKIAESLESLFDGTPKRDPNEERMADKQPVVKQQQVVEQQQRAQEADAAKWRKAELEAYLDQRDKERHIDRGR